MVYQLPATSVVSWANGPTGHVVPVAIDSVCPVCRKSVTFVPGDASNLHAVRGQPLNVRCPRCGDTVSLIRLGGVAAGDVRLYFDAEDPARPPVADLDLVPDDVISPALKKAYQSALNVLAIGEPEATAVTCRRVLEGITRKVLPADVQTTNLARRIEALTNEREALARPLLELSDTLREGGNLGAHFSDEIETSIDDARRMVDLLDYLITYLFVLPEQIHRFRAEVLKESSGE
ncbi:DUF4145 domain-containing protein [Nocardioides immobilis]|uniref:DUF4145 domain-containing protein n=1 Tax=Nocardioides immobilis TaxID=2049295 RepID=A0A417XY51_9ACTN|nr:DUF4145 domain-containing protein [Nocardioides immobilis]RHW25220.1 DUF4145 domain-containing protein [Nocardioides immobilis]